MNSRLRAAKLPRCDGSAEGSTKLSSGSGLRGLFSKDVATAFARMFAPERA